jgi:kinesin family member 6/9
MMGSYIRKTNSTQINQVSSRSHCIFTLNVKAKNLSTSTELYSKIHLVDLAGSERVSKSQAEGIVLTEAKSINLSLTYLEQVIVSLNQKMKNKGKAPHVPYRNSMLTTLLKDSLGGNCKTVMIATISMDKSNQDETVSTLRFAQRVKLIENEMNKN